MWGMLEHLFQGAGQFFADPYYMAAVTGSLVMAIAMLGASRRTEWTARTRSFLMYGHLVLLVLPLVLFAATLSCQEKGICEVGVTQTLLVVVPVSGFLALLAGLWIVPLLHRQRGLAEDGPLQQYVRNQAEGIGMRVPDVFWIDSGKPQGYSVGGLKPAIFVSIGMGQLLSRRQLEAVLLHELGHIREGSHALKTLSIFLHAWHPQALPAPQQVVQDEEAKADGFAAGRQKTRVHLERAKKKVG